MRAIEYSITLLCYTAMHWTILRHNCATHSLLILLGVVHKDKKMLFQKKKKKTGSQVWNKTHGVVKCMHGLIVCILILCLT